MRLRDNVLLTIFLFSTVDNSAKQTILVISNSKWYQVSRPYFLVKFA